MFLNFRLCSSTSTIIDGWICYDEFEAMTRAEIDWRKEPLDLVSKCMKSWGLEEYHITQQLRNELSEVRAEVIKQLESKRGLSSKSEAQDNGISLLRLRSAKCNREWKLCIGS